MLFDKIVFNICNSLVYLSVGFLLLFHIEPDLKKWHPGWLAIIYISMWFFFPHFGLSVLWLSGSCNYLWMCTIQLWFLLYYKRYIDYPETEKRLWIKTIGITFLGFLCGWSNENGGGATILLSALFVSSWIWNKKKIPVWSISGIIAACIGFIILLLAPSSTSRIDLSLKTGVFLKRLREVSGFSVRYLFLLCILLLIVVICSVKIKNEIKKNWIELYSVPFFYCISGAASVIVLIASPVISGKSWLWAVCFMLIAIGLILKNGVFQKYNMKWYVKFALVIFCICAGVRYSIAFMDISHTYQEQTEQIEQLQEQKAQGFKEVVIPLLTPSDNLYNAISRTPNVNKSSESWFNQWMALYYGVDSVTGVERK